MKHKFFKQKDVSLDSFIFIEVFSFFIIYLNFVGSSIGGQDCTFSNVAWL